MQAAPLWDPTQCQFVGLLKVTDFIDILRIYKRTNADVASLATRSIADMINDPTIAKAVHLTFGFPSADSTTSLKQACKLLLAHSSSKLNKINSNGDGDGGGNDQRQQSIIPPQPPSSSLKTAAGSTSGEEESKINSSDKIDGSKSSNNFVSNTSLDFLPIVMP